MNAIGDGIYYDDESEYTFSSRTLFYRGGEYLYGKRFDMYDSRFDLLTSILVYADEIAADYAITDIGIWEKVGEDWYQIGY